MKNPPNFCTNLLGRKVTIAYGLSVEEIEESVKKGLQVAAASLMSISEYVKNIQKISQVSF